MHDIPLKVLVVDPNQASSDSLTKALSTFKVVLSVRHCQTLSQASEILQRSDVNTIYIDPIELGLEAASDFIFRLRERLPHIVFVLYFDFEKQAGGAEKLYEGNRRRFRGYFKLDKKMAGRPEFMRKLQDTILSCQGDLYSNLTQEKISSLQKELAAIQRGTSDDEAALVPLSVLKEIQEQLAARKEEAKASSLLHSPAKFLGSSASVFNPTSCFVIMPYSQSWSRGVEAIFLESCKEAGFELQIAKTMDGRFVPHDIWQGITGCGVVIADLTGANANVTYEVGLADAVGREVVLVCQDTGVPFDFLGQRLIVYQNTVEGALTLRRDLTDRLKVLKKKLSDPSAAR